MYGSILFTYFIFISNNNWRLSCKKGVHGQFYVTDITFRGQILGLKLFLTYFSQAIFCLKFVQVFITWYLTISRRETLISFSKALNIFVLNSVTDITKLESADTVVVGSIIMISNIVGPGFSYTSFACLIHLSPEMLADEIQCTLRIGIKCHFHITSNLTELCMFWWLFSEALHTAAEPAVHAAVKN